MSAEPPRCPPLWLALALACSIDERLVAVNEAALEAESSAAPAAAPAPSAGEDAGAAEEFSWMGCMDGVACAPDIVAVAGTTDADARLDDAGVDAGPEPCAGCRIDGACVPGGSRHPDNPCLTCDPARDPAAWSPNDGLICDDGRYCTELAACTDGACRRVLARDCGFDDCSEARRACVCQGDC